MSSPTPQPPIIPPDIASSTGPQLIGTLFNWAFFGVLSMQVYVYYLNFPDDRIRNKILIYGSYIIEVVQTAMTAADLYFWFATGFGNLNHLNNVNLGPLDTPILCSIIAAIVQCFFAFRIYTLRKSLLWMSILVVLTSILQSAAGIASGYRAFKLQEYSRFHENIVFPQSFAVWILADVVCDVLIAGTMLWLLYKSRQDGTKYGTHILSKLVRLIVETNTLTAGVAFTSFILYVVLPNSSWYISMTLIMGKLYSNTLLVTFNNRIALRKVDMSYEINSEGKASDRLPIRIRRTTEMNTEISTFHVATNSPVGDPEIKSSF